MEVKYLERNNDKEKILRCPELNYSRPEGQRKRQEEIVSQLTARHSDRRLLIFLSVCWNFEVTSR